MADRLDGTSAETLAANHLQRAGLRLLTRNFRCPRGEIDLVMDDRGTLVFVEVRYRRSAAFGSPAESVDPRKRARIETAARHFLATLKHEPPCRFDVVAVSGHEAQIDWLRDAFRPE